MKRILSLFLFVMALSGCTSLTPSEYWLPGQSSHSWSIGVSIVYGKSYTIPIVGLTAGVRQNFNDYFAFGIEVNAMPVPLVAMPYVVGRIPIASGSDFLPYVGLPFYYGGYPEGVSPTVVRWAPAIGGNVQFSSENGSFWSLGLKYDPSIQFRWEDKEWNLDPGDINHYAVDATWGVSDGEKIRIGRGEYDFQKILELSGQQVNFYQ